YWSHDGSSTAGSEPTSAVTLNVANGLYAVLLGDSAVAGMTRLIPASVFANSDVRLRVWFSDGTNGSQLLTPDKRIAAVAYAMVASSLDAAGMTAVQLASQTAVDAAIQAAVVEVTAAKAAQKTAEDALAAANASNSQLRTDLAAARATIQSNAATTAALRTQLTTANNKVTALTQTLGTKDATITALTIQVADLNTALANAEAKNVADKAALQQQITALTYLLDGGRRNAAITKNGTTVNYIFNGNPADTHSLNSIYDQNGNYVIGDFGSSIWLIQHNATQSGPDDYGDGPYTVVTGAPDGIVISTDASSLPSQRAQIRGLNEGTTSTAVTADGWTITTTTVTGTSPAVVVSIVAVPAGSTPNGTVVTTTPGIKALTAQAAQATQLQSDLAAANVKVTELTNTIGQKNEVITSLSTQVQELGDALTNAQTQFSFEKAAFEKQIEDFGNILLLEDALKDQGVTITAETRRWDGFNMTSQSITTDTRTGVFIRRGPLVPDNVNPWGTIIVTKIPGIAALQAQIRGLNEGTTITAVTLNGVTTTTTTVTGSSPLVIISVVTTNTPGTPNGTVVTTTPGINGLNAQITALQNPPAS
ncbi:MAG: hypothetical protein NTV80_02725, partial [Verrucomicrobia bacterium]|nr:hypothetical protein [Verrucomicrobiota bacterium]